MDQSPTMRQFSEWMREAAGDPRLVVSTFQRFATWAARAMGHPRAFLLALLFVFLWLISGPLFGFSTGWQLVINTGTTIVTFLMVFLIQSTQNRDSAAAQIKLDELIRATDGAHNALLNLEGLDEDELDLIQAQYRQLATIARRDMAAGRPDTSIAEVDFRDEMGEAELTARALRVLEQRVAESYRSATTAIRETGARYTDGRLAPENAQVQALKRLIAGNRRFVAGKPQRPHQTLQRRAALSEEQQPFAAILGCSDSRVAHEIIFDQGIGDLFSVRVAGNVVDGAVENSLEYAVEQLGVPLIVVLGHERCGAVQAAVAAITAGADISAHSNTIVQAIAPVARLAASRDGDPVENTIRDNIYLSVDRLRTAEDLSRFVDSGTVEIIGAYYDLDTGEVEFLA